jgi:hypothetical protein
MTDTRNQKGEFLKQMKKCRENVLDAIISRH